ncbi:hypothetical protein AB6829_08660 [Carnobacterium divergens]
MRKNPYFPTVMSLYINYILQGMAAIILAQNMVPLMKQFGTTAAGMSLVISSNRFRSHFDFILCWTNVR